MGTIEFRSGAYRAMVRKGGHRLSSTHDTREQAQSWINRTEIRIANGERPKSGQRDPATMTAADFFERYAREISPSKRGGRWEVIRLKALQREPEFQVLASDMDGSDLAIWRDRRLRVVSAATVNRDLNLISAVFSRAVKEWKLRRSKENPVRDVLRPKQPKGRKRLVSQEERDAICKQLGWDQESSPSDLYEWVAWAFSFALETGMRQGEILGMRGGDVHGRSVYLPRTKNGHERHHPLSQAAVRLLEIAGDLKDGSKIVPLESGTCGVYFREACKGACITDLHFHDARHAAATRFAKKVGPMELARILGHEDTRSTMRYYHPDADDLADKLG